MLKVERYSRIMALPETHESMEVDELGEILPVSGNTVRRNLAHLEEKGMPVRIQGGATLAELQKCSLPPHDRIVLFPDEKKGIAREAAGLVKPNASIIFDAGSTALAIRAYLKGISDLTVITKSLPVCNALAHAVPLSMIASGGILLESTDSFVGKPAEALFAFLHADLLFLGAKGVSENLGLSNENFYETPVKQKRIAAADRIMLPADNSRFGRESLSGYASLGDIDTGITAGRLDQQHQKLLEAGGIEMIIASDAMEGK